MNTNHLYEFQVLAEVLSYTKAAKRLFISQSILTRHIQELEHELGAELFQRSTHGVALTEVGRMLARRSQELINKWDSAQGRLLRRSVRTLGRVRIALSLELSYSGHVRSFFESFSKRYTDIELIYDVISGSMGSQTVADYDFVFMPNDLDTLPAAIKRLHMRRHGAYLILPPGHALLSKSAVYLHQLSRQTLIVPFADEFFSPYARNHLLAEKATKGQVASIKVDNLHTALFLVSMGKGVCIAPRYVLNMVPIDTFHVTMSDPSCRFDEYLYYNEMENDAAWLFFEEFSKEVNIEAPSYQ